MALLPTYMVRLQGDTMMHLCCMRANCYLSLRKDSDHPKYLHCTGIQHTHFVHTYLVTRDQQSFNKSMSKVRVSVEWTFGKVVQYFAFLDFKKNLKVLLQPIGMYYVVGAILTNCHTCLYGSTTSRFFNVAPPDLQNYLGH